MRRYWWLAAPPLLLAMSLKVGSSIEDPVRALTGHYLSRTTDAQGKRVDSVVEIVPIAARHAYVHFDLHAPDGARCELTGIADAVGPALIYRASRHSSARQCRITIRRQDRRLTYVDAGDTCASLCSARDGFDGSMAWSTRRRIAESAKLRTSQPFLDAVEEWRHLR
ncbi:hypothetical protein IFT82_17455 [Sphingomonas sp. CFBP 8760]|nr:hypothetical protein [Sphingomonas sp. CFBP 8760]